MLLPGAEDGGPGPGHRQAGHQGPDTSGGGGLTSIIIREALVIRLALEAQTASDHYQVYSADVTWHWYSPESLGCTPVILRLHSLVS